MTDPQAVAAPRTAAGRELLNYMWPEHADEIAPFSERIRAIEAEATPPSEPLRAALERLVDVFADGIGMHSVNAGFCSLTDEGHEAIEQARAALQAEGTDGVER